MMKNKCKIFVTLVAIVVFCSFYVTDAEASSKELKNTWYTTRTFPMNVESKEWKEYGLVENLDILNPPKDLIDSMTSNELADLMFNYPHLWVLTSYEYDQKDYFWDYLLNNCDIFNEILNREDGIECLLNKYLQTEFSAEIYNKNPYQVWGYNKKLNAEVFACQFINYMIAKPERFSEYSDQVQYVIEIKEKEYSYLEENDTKLYLTFEKGILGKRHSFDDTYLGTDMVSRADGFVATGTSYLRQIENVDIYFTPGTYHKYGTDSNCLKWDSGDYSEEKRTSLNNSIAYNWSRLAQSSPKYNCHGYAWLNANGLNGYWLDTPISYINSGSVTSIYQNSVQNGDIIVMYNSSGKLVHSAVVCSGPSGSTGIYTTSKIGGRGLYVAPLSELQTYYSSSSYAVYRP